MPLRHLIPVLFLTACLPAAAQDSFAVTGTDGTALTAQPTDTFDAAWAMATLPDGRMLVTEKEGNLVLVSAEGARLGLIDGTPPAQDSGQGGMGDVILHPDFAQNGLIYMSPVEWEGGRSGAVIYRARLDLTETGGTLSDLQRIWQQVPKGETTRHYSQRMAFGPDGLLYVTSGDRGLQTPSQDMGTNMGKILRLNDDGSPAAGNPFAADGGVAAEFWTTGHRNPLGLAFASDGTLWSHEMGPRGGDELNRIEAGSNYGWPVVSDGDNYSGVVIPDHDTTEQFTDPAISWNPVISPSGLVMYDGDLFSDWRGQAVMGGLSSQAVIRVAPGAGGAQEVARYSWGERIREVEQAPDGAIWALEDGYGGRLIRLTPAG
ncbi:MAG: PQQ-dependent sugar dehydrogenase [Pseudomonadota bacterium]